MSKQIYYEDILVGQETPVLEKNITNINMAMYCAVNWLMDRIHYDHIFATKERGLPDVVEPGNMGLDYYCQLLDDWIGEKGQLRKISVQYRDFRVPGDTIKCRGKVINKYVEDKKGFIELEISMIKNNEVNCVPGKALVELPIRDSKN
jgi:acyl dehydratase